MLKNVYRSFLVSLAVCSSLATAETCISSVTNVTVHAQNGYVMALLKGYGWVALCTTKIADKALTCKPILALATAAQVSKQLFYVEYNGTCAQMTPDGYAAADKIQNIGLRL